MDETLAGDVAAGGVTWAAVGSMAALAFVATWTPGPNNMMLASSGATFGFRRTIPHALGVALGFPAMYFAVALGFETILLAIETQLAEIHPLLGRLREALTLVAAAVLVWFGVRIALSGRQRADQPNPDARSGRPFSFWEAAAFQWINPKAWAMAIGAATLYFQGAPALTKASVGAGLFVCAGLTSAHFWAGFGATLRRILQKGSRLQIFNGVMGALVVASVLFLFLE